MAMTSLDERILVEAHNGGDIDAFVSIVNEYSPSLYAHAVMRLGEPRAAEDAVQETFLRAFRAMPRFEGEFHLRAWLHRILTNVCFDEGDRRRREIRTFDRMASLADPVMPPADEVLDLDRDAAQREVATALASLPDAYREALELRYVEQLSFREVAVATGVSEENARARVHRGRAALRRLISGPYAFAAFFIPALRKGERAAQTALSGGGDAAASATTSASTLMQSAPTFTRLAVELSGPMSTKAGIVAGVVAAATTVAVPVASTVAEHTFAPAPASVAAAPAAGTETAPLGAPQDTTVVIDQSAPAPPDAAAATPADASATKTADPTQPAEPTQPGDQQTFSAPPASSTGTGAAATASPGTNAAAATAGAASPTDTPSSTSRTLAGSSIVATASADQIALSGPASFGASGELTGAIDGTLTITPGASADDPVRLDGTLTFTAVDGSVQTMRVALRAVPSTDANGLTTYAISVGRYELTDATGATATGGLAGSIAVGLGNMSTLALTLS